jgi:hypothetical protein
MVENLLGKGDTLRSLVRLDVRHDMQRSARRSSAAFVAPCSCCPSRASSTAFQGDPEGGLDRPGSSRTAQRFGSGLPAQGVRISGLATASRRRRAQAELDAGQLALAAGWRADARPCLKEYEQQSVYVFGVARNTPCGIREEKGRLKMVGTTQGDGTVTWRLRTDRQRRQLTITCRRKHGDLPSTSEYSFGARPNCCTAAPPVRLLRSPPAVRGDADWYGRSSMMPDHRLLASRRGGGTSACSAARRSNRVAPRSKRRLEVSGAGRWTCASSTQPILLGHYEQDPISGAEALIDRELLDGDLGERYNLGLYAGPRGTCDGRAATCRTPRSGGRGSRCYGAVVCGLGSLRRRA